MNPKEINYKNFYATTENNGNMKKEQSLLPCPFFEETIVNRYDIKPEGLGEINIDLSDDGEWVRFEDIEHLLSDAQKKGV